MSAIGVGEAGLAQRRALPSVRGMYAAGALVMLGLAVPLGLAAGLDPRVLDDAEIWQKPLRFALALALYLGTLAVYVRWLPAAALAGRRIRLFAAGVVAASTIEMAWLIAAASLGTRSHYNTLPVWSTLYPMMGAFAVFLTAATLVHGRQFLRDADAAMAPPVRLALALGLIATFVLTVIVAGTAAQFGGHDIGVAPEGSARWPLLGWSMVVGDVRVPHFLATHALHAIPLAGVVAARLAPGPRARTLVLLAAAGYCALVLATFAEALAGRPFLGWAMG